MDVSGVSTGASASTAQKNGDSAQTSALKKTLEIQTQTATQTDDAVPQLPENLGQNINVKA